MLVAEKQFLRPEIDAVLSQLSARIRRYVFLEGTALVVLLLGGLFWFSLGVDWLWFQASKLELPVWVRLIFDILAIGTLAGVAVTWVVLRTARKLQARALALVLERRFPELDDRLITAVETSAAASPRTPLTGAMLERTVNDVSRAVARLDVGDVFEKMPLRRALFGATAVVVSIVVFGIANAQAVDRWWRAFNPFHLQADYWDRNTQLLVRVLADPGERVKQFKDRDGNATDGKPGTYRHPRGSDLALLVEVPEGDPGGRAFEVPDRVEIHYQLDNNRGSGHAYMSRMGDRRFRFTLPSLQDGMTFFVQGGDYVNRHPYRIDVVEPPRVDHVVLECDYPDYTRLDPVDGSGKPLRDNVPVQGSQISIPRETDLLLRVSANKPLAAARIVTAKFEIELNREGGKLTTLSQEGKAQRTVTLPDPWGTQLNGDGENPPREFRLPLLLTDRVIEQPAGETVTAPIPLPSDSLLRITLEDTDDVTAGEPARLTINGVADLPPVIETRLKGIGSSITRKAVIPLVGQVTDDYGVAAAHFEFRRNDSPDSQTRALEAPPQGLPRNFPLERAPEQPSERFEVLPLDLADGQKLTLTLYAEDGDNLNGPHSSRGESYTFNIVSNEELLSILYAKELNLRRRFEQIIQEVEETRADLIVHRQRTEEAQKLKARTNPLSDAERKQLSEIELAVETAAERSLHQVRKNAGETQAVEVSFGEILEELVNNGVHTQQMVDRIIGLIVTPLHDVNEGDFPRVDQSLGVFKLAHQRGQNCIPQIDESVRDIDAMILHMKNVLKEMQQLVDLHEMVKELKQIIEWQEHLSDETKHRRKDDLLKRLKGLGSP